MSRLVRAAVATALVSALLGCPSRPKELIYDLAARAAVADRWAAADVLLFGTPSAEPRLTDGFYREAAGGEAEPFLWSKEEAEVAFEWEEPVARVAILDVAPYAPIPDLSVEVRLNGAEVEAYRLNDVRHPYRIGLPP